MSLLGIFEFALIICVSVLVLFGLIWVALGFLKCLKCGMNRTVFKSELKRLYISWKKPIIIILTVKAGAIIIIGILVIITALGMGQS